jgi:hypothetical protein
MHLMRPPPTLNKPLKKQQLRVTSAPPGTAKNMAYAAPPKTGGPENLVQY